MKTKEELNKLKEEFETLNKKLCELTEEEMEQVTGGEKVPHTGLVLEPSVLEPPVPTPNRLYYDE